MRTFLSLTSVSSAALLAAAFSLAPAAAETAQNGALINPDDPMTIVVSLPNQKAKVYRGTSLITSTPVSTGKPGHATRAGVYGILEKRRRHFSNLYNNAPMPWMQRLTWTGTALHAGVIPGYPASHGCIRLPYSFAPKLFKMTEIGGQVVVAHGMVTPKRIAHPALFQPLPPPMPPELLTQNTGQDTAKDAPAATKPVRKSSNDASGSDTSANETAAARPFRLPVVLAKASAVTPKPIAAKGAARLALLPAVAGTPEVTGSLPPAGRFENARALQDTTRHAIDPDAAPFVGSGSHMVAAKNPAVRGEAAVETTDDFMKHQDRLTDRRAPKAQDRLEEKDVLQAKDPQTAQEDTQQEDTVTPAAPELTDAKPAPETASDDPIARLVRATQPDATAPETETAAPAGPTVTAHMLEAKAQEPVAGSLLLLGVNDHPPLPLTRPSVMLSRIKAGARAAAIEAAEPISQEPLRILVTRRTDRDRTIDIQYILSDMGYLAPLNFDGTRGSATIRALKAFQKDHEMPVTGAFTDDVSKKIYEVAGKDMPPEGQLFVRQKFASVFSTPVSFSNPDKPLGTHLFTIMHFEPGATKADWTAISLNDKESAISVLDRIDIPADVRQRISERLTPGSSLIVADTAINSAALPKGADFLVWDTSKPAKVHRTSASPRRSVRRRSTATRQRATRQRPSYSRERARTRYTRRAPQRRSRSVFGF